jgi:hypothetical protein
MANNKKRKLIDQVLTSFGVVATVALLAIGGLAWWGQSFISKNVYDQLAEQKIYFPEKGSPAIAALPEADQKEVNKYAGQQLLTGAQAKVFADNYIAVHLKKVAGGQTYAQVSAKAQADPTDAKLQAQTATLFKGETLRGLLLGDAYAFGTMGELARIAALVAFAAAAVMAVLTLLGFWHLSRL